eukprot:EST47726.1 Hypothetical protein SS50377_12124 [Spironucleus salmonicida]
MSRQMYLNKQKQVLEIEEESSTQQINQLKLPKYNQASVDQVRQYLDQFDWDNIRLNAENVSDSQFLLLYPHILANLHLEETTWALLRFSFAKNFYEIMPQELSNLVKAIKICYLSSSTVIQRKLLKIIKNIGWDSPFDFRCALLTEQKIQDILFIPCVYEEHFAIARFLFSKDFSYDVDGFCMKLETELSARSSLTFKRNTVIYLSEFIRYLGDSHVSMVSQICMQFFVPEEILNKRFQAALIVLLQTLVGKNQINNFKAQQLDLWLKRVIDSSIAWKVYKLVQQLCEQQIDLRESYMALIQKVHWQTDSYEFGNLLYTVQWIMDLDVVYNQAVYEQVMQINQFEICEDNIVNFQLQSIVEKLIQLEYEFDCEFLENIHVKLYE